MIYNQDDYTIFQPLLTKYRYPMKKLLSALVISATVLFSCSKEAKLSRKIDGEWNVTTIDSEPLVSESIVFKFEKDKNFPLPHVGFSKVFHSNSKIWKDIPNKSYFYFIHSFRLKNTSNIINIATSIYGEEFMSFIEKDNVLRHAAPTPTDSLFDAQADFV